MTRRRLDVIGKKVVITGANGGIGLRLARAITEAGADVAIWARRPDANAAALESLGRWGRASIALQCDVTDASSVEDATAKTVAALGRVDACVVNAALRATPHRFHEYPLDEWERVVSVNLTGAFVTARAVAGEMLRQGGDGSIVFVAGLPSFFGQPQRAPYAAAKAGVLGLMRTVAAELGRHGIRANAIVPGWAATETTQAVLDKPAIQERVLPRVPMRRWGTPDEMAGVVIYLISDASTYHTGDVLTVDGGYSVF